MYKCEECGNVFEEGEQAVWREDHGEQFSGCPICKETYREIEPCKICGSYNHDFDESFCDDCKDDFKINLKYVLNQNFSKEEIELFEEIYGGL